VKLTEEAARLFAGNGYERAELDDFFRRGAVWFGLKEGGRLVSACFVYPNCASVWEIASVWTEAECRGRGFAKTVVLTALDFLAGRGLTPRYHVRSDNRASIALARSCGLVEFLKFDHYFVKPPATEDRPKKAARRPA
jgi:ribosomal protein S18 acetylase RimI-like enzyme